MLANRLTQLLLGVVAVLLAVVAVQVAFQSPTPAQAALTFPDSDRVYDVRMVARVSVENPLEVIPLDADADGQSFVVRQKTGLVILRCGYFTEE